MVADCSTKPEAEDEEAMRHMVEEMKGLRCGTNTDNAYELDDTASEESDAEGEPKRSVATDTIVKESASTIAPESCSGETGPSPTGLTCNVCTTMHTLPLPICCETCNNVLQPEKLPKEKTWKCMAPGCDGIALGYANFQDAGRCGLCGSKRLHAS
jgi:hypothetical protein